jgi:hypothetical protein
LSKETNDQNESLRSSEAILNIFVHGGLAAGYRELREAARETLARVREAGYAGVKADGKSEAMEIFRLTCLEESMPLERAPSSPLPEVRVEGMGFVVGWPE